MNKQEFLQSKFDNFIAFLRAKLATINPADRAHAEGFLSQYSQMTPGGIIALCTHFAMYKGRTDAIVDKLLQESQLPRASFSAEDLDRCKRYIDMFIDIVCSLI